MATADVAPATTGRPASSRASRVAAPPGVGAPRQAADRFASLHEAVYAPHRAQTTVSPAAAKSLCEAWHLLATAHCPPLGKVCFGAAVRLGAMALSRGVLTPSFSGFVYWQACAPMTLIIKVASAMTASTASGTPSPWLS